MKGQKLKLCFDYCHFLIQILQCDRRTISKTDTEGQFLKYGHDYLQFVFVAKIRKIGDAQT